jgi:hypothetical protein
MPELLKLITKQALNLSKTVSAGNGGVTICRLRRGVITQQRTILRALRLRLSIDWLVAVAGHQCHYVGDLLDKPHQPCSLAGLVSQRRWETWDLAFSGACEVWRLRPYLF